ncbi:MAG: hypothetical protein OXJ55_16285, partial [Caldilineaceae bacterium]|nr:hypothetical protein [Caldilineaceae bacterium]
RSQLRLATTTAQRFSSIDLEEDITFLAVTVIDALLAPVLSVAITLLYFDIRVRKEGLDIEMIRKMIGLGGDMDRSFDERGYRLSGK